MIKMDNLKPILEPLLADREDAASIIEALAGIDTEPEVTGEDAIAAAVAENDAKWAERYRDTFFGRVTAEVSASVTEPETTTSPDEAGSFDDLFA